MNNKIKIGVMGSAKRSKDLPDVLSKNAVKIGRKIAQSDCILVTGSCMGVPKIAAKAASDAGGLVLGYSPASNIKDHLEPPTSYPLPAENEILLYTGYGKIGRNVLSISQCDAVIFVGGGIGTLNEFTIAYHEGKVIGVLSGVGSVVERVVKEEKQFRETGSKIIIEKDPQKLVEKVIQQAEKNRKKPRKEISINFENERGKFLAGVLHIPEKEKPPVVIICHGFQNHKTDRKFIKLARRLRERGILAFRFDFEGCGDSEGEPRDLTIEKEVSDLYAAYNTVLKQCDVDHHRVVVVGVSLGSVVASLFVKKIKTPLKGLIFWSQAFNQKNLFSVWHTEEDRKEMKKQGFIARGDKEIGEGYYKENHNKDYTNIISEVNLPILLIQGEKDKDVPLEFSEKAAKDNKNVTLKVISGADHKFKEPYHQEELINLSIEEIEKRLK